MVLHTNNWQFTIFTTKIHLDCILTCKMVLQRLERRLEVEVFFEAAETAA